MSLRSDSRVPVMHITAKFLYKGSSRPINSMLITARLYDKDIFEDDFIEVTHLSPEGEAKFTLHPELIRSWDSLFESRPDLYVVLERVGENVFITPVAKDLDIKNTGDFDSETGIHFNLGTYLVDISEED